MQSFMNVQMSESTDGTASIDNTKILPLKTSGELKAEAEKAETTRIIGSIQPTLNNLGFTEANTEAIAHAIKESYLGQRDIYEASLRKKSDKIEDKNQQQ